MKKNIAITFNNGDKIVHKENTLLFSSLVQLFKLLLEKKLPKSGSPPKSFNDDVLFFVEKHDIKIIEFGSFRKYTFNKKICEHRNVSYEVLCDVLVPSLDELLGSMNENTKVHIFGGDLEDLRKLSDADLPKPLREIFDCIQSEMESEADRDERQTHETTSTKH